MDRRAFIGAVGTGSGMLVAGCTGLGNGDGEPLDGEWVLSGRIENADQVARDWLVECLSKNRDSVVSVAGTLPSGQEHTWELSGRLVDETREIGVRSERGGTSRDWDPTECRRLGAVITLTDTGPSLETECRSE